MEVYLESGTKRVFAAALRWPGWTRGGRTEADALAALVAAGPRYALVASLAGEALTAPSVSDLVVAERLPGDASTDFGAPGRVPAADHLPLDDLELRRQAALLEACWRRFDEVAAAAEGVALRTGPRGGGRPTSGIVEHVVGAEQSYAASLTGTRPAAYGETLETWQAVRRGVLDAIAELREAPPRTTPRRRVLWPPRYFVRRAAWHVLDHLWEIEDRSA
jgi:hypothetical protein